ncbi:translocon at the outer membrane of chloroplasts 64 [Dorcoceras hygrometricum]|uniref:Translocon at the outer membrane of chloroplasts 64 n=1 Tax=Dorcoceras hygrometricum TaxID=472368 RepID=A0A2Z7AZL3_9LAMI|nr:translocon at the outer membrane of chloroplasts 64 [Dorcoceras hygrometricum]
MASSSANLWVLLGLGLAGILIMAKKLTRAVKEDFGAFIERLQLLPPPQPAPPKAPHPLTGLTFAVSDVFDIEGFVTGFGNPDWSRTHEPATSTSPVVTALVDGGATCTGKTVVDDMAFSLSGENKHYGAPTNPTSPARIPGGASSGAAVAVAANFVDFSLGIDTDGGVRVPAGYCGVLGFRPSYGILSPSGVISVSGSLDTVGWFAKDPSVLRRVGHVLLQVPYTAQRNPRSVVISDDLFQLSKVPSSWVTQGVIKSIEKLYGRQVLRHENIGEYLALKIPSLKSFQVKQSNGEGKSSPIRLIANVLQIIKRYEFRQSHSEWIDSVKPAIDPVISAQIAAEVLGSADTEIEKCQTIKSELRAALNSLLKDEGILVIPTTISPPAKLGSKEIILEDYLIQTSTLSSLASMSGCCQVAIPLGVYDKCPVSVSLLARHGGDRFLLDTLQTLYTSLQEQVDIASKSKSSSVVTQEESAEMAKEKGNQAFKDNHWQRAIGFYSEAIKLNSGNATYYSNRAAAYLQLGSYIQAEEDCSRAIDLDKKVSFLFLDVLPLHMHATFCSSSLLCEKTSSCSTNILLSIRNVKAFLRRGTAREMLGYYKEAMEAVTPQCKCQIQFTTPMLPTNEALKGIRIYFSSKRD